MYVGGEVITGTKCEIDRAQTTDRLKFVPVLTRRGGPHEWWGGGVRKIRPFEALIFLGKEEPRVSRDRVTLGALLTRGVMGWVISSPYPSSC